MEKLSTLSSEKRNDLHLTSTGVGHSYKQPVESSLSNFKSIRNNPLPPELENSSADKHLTNIYQTTTSTEHCPQPTGTVLEQPVHKRAPGSWKVNHTLDTIHKLDVKPWRQPLTMANQHSEMKAAYRGKAEDIQAIISHSGNPQPPMLADHFTEGPTKGLQPSTVNRAIKGRSFIPQNQAVLDRVEPYMTTNNWYHRTFSGGELKKYPKKNVATYWQCEDYPKAWGHGMRENPLPRKLCRTDPGPMRDRTVFQTGTTIPTLPSSSQPITRGLASIYSDTYTKPSSEQRRQLFHCPVEPLNVTEVPDKTLLEAVPHMYKTMNMSYGSRPPQVTS